MQLNQIIHTLQSIYQHLEKQRNFSRKNELHDANRFNPLQFLTTNENGLSAILAFLLNPNETHGQHDLFLNSFLKQQKLYSFLSYERISVTLEKATSSKRRHDIFIEGWIRQERVWVLSIENKLRGANDQENQLTDYLIDLEKYAKQTCLIYLPAIFTPPSEISISEKERNEHIEQNKLKILDANDLIEWLGNTPILAPKIIQFTEYLIQFLKEDIMGETNETSKLVEHIVSNPQNLDAALEILAAGDNIYEALWLQLVKQLENRCINSKFDKLLNKGWVIGNHRNPYSRSKWSNWIGFGSEKQNDETLVGVGFKFDSTHYRNAYYAAWIDEKSNLYNNETLITSLKEIENNQNTEDNFYHFWDWLQGDLRNWENSTWLRIPTGQLADEIFEKWKPLLEIFEQNID